MNNQQLKSELERQAKEIADLKMQINSMKSSNSFPKDIGDAVAERISDKNQAITRASTVASTSSIYKEVSLTGEVETINVCAFPDGFRVFRLGGKDYHIPYYNLT